MTREANSFFLSLRNLVRVFFFVAFNPSKPSGCYVVAYRPIDKQRFYKQWPLLGNVRNIHALNIRITVFSMLSARRSSDQDRFNNEFS